MMLDVEGVMQDEVQHGPGHRTAQCAACELMLVTLDSTS